MKDFILYPEALAHILSRRKQTNSTTAPTTKQIFEGRKRATKTKTEIE
jgi:hypothetical protein